MSNAPERCDLLILGMGSTAVAASREAKRLNKSVILIEEDLIGGTCLNYGCVPSKFLIEASKVYHSMTNPSFRGITCSPSLEFSELIKQKDEIVKSYRAEKENHFSSEEDEVDVVRGHAEFIDEHTVEVGERRFTASRILIATGTRPGIPDIKGLKESGYLTSDLLTSEDNNELKKLPKSIAVIGGGYIALELGQMFKRFGTEVTILEVSPALLSDANVPEISSSIQKIFSDEGIRVYCDTDINSIEMKDGLHLIKMQTSDGERELSVERIVVATGRQANTDRIGIEQAGVTLSKDGYIRVDKQLRTNVPHIFAAGDVIGSAIGNQMATPVGIKDGVVAVANAFAEGELESVDHSLIPRAIFTDPEIALIGISESEAKEQKIDFEVRMVKIERVPRAVLMQHTEGFTKLISEVDSGKILGAGIVGSNAGEIIHEVAMAMRRDGTVSDLAELMYVYPSMSEAVKLTSQAKPLTRGSAKR